MRFREYAVAIVLAASALAAPARADKAMLVFDASGSMWGQVDDRAKIEVARQVVRDLVQDWPGTTELGLMAYGHREKANCEDIQTLVPVGPLDGAAIRGAIDRVDPKGKTPISAAVRRAAHELRSEEGKATVILVSDGLETCNEDPCAVARELEKSGVDFTVHVVGFDTSEDENRQLRCLADVTGGRFLRARNASELKRAMTTTVELVKEAEPPPRPKKTVSLLLPGTATATVESRNSRYVLSLRDPQSGETVAYAYLDVETAHVAAGSYRAFFGPYEVATIEVKAGDAVTLDGSKWLGAVTAPDLDPSELLVMTNVRTGDSSILGATSPSDEVPPGRYKLEVDNREVGVIDVVAGEETVVSVSRR